MCYRRYVQHCSSSTSLALVPTSHGISLLVDSHTYIQTYHTDISSYRPTIEPAICMIRTYTQTITCTLHRLQSTLPRADTRGGGEWRGRVSKVSCTCLRVWRHLCTDITPWPSGNGRNLARIQHRPRAADCAEPANGCSFSGHLVKERRGQVWDGP